MYYGEAITRLDDKGRITVPRDIREKMKALRHKEWFLTRGFDGCIFMFEGRTWDKLRTQASRYSTMNAKAMDFRRLLFGSLADAEIDAQGRMAVPLHLREYANLTRDVVLLGVDDHLQIWDKEAWRAFQKTKEAEFKEMAAPFFAGDDDRGGDMEKGGPDNGDSTSGSGAD